MICVNCLHPKTSIINSRQHKKRPLTWRRHRCQRCDHVFTTREQPDASYLRIEQLTGSKQQPFNLGKLIISIANNFQHSPVTSSYDSLFLAQTVQDKLLAQRQQSILPSNIAQLTYQTLLAFDPAAAIQYAAQHGLHDLITANRPNRKRRNLGQ